MIHVSAGHHIRKQGAEFNGVTEYSLTVKWADRIFELLGHERALRVPNGFLADKVRFINQHHASLAVEIHFNSAAIWKDKNNNNIVDEGEIHRVGRGSETLYYPGSKTGKEAAELMQDNLSRVLSPNRGAKEGWYRMNKSNGPDFFLAKTSCTALIIEPEFIDNLEVIGNNFDEACHVIADTLLQIHNEVI